MKFGCYIVDDEPVTASLIIEYINRHDDLILLGYESNSVIAASKLLSDEIMPDISFFDIQMPGIDGIELGTMVRHKTAIIFTTAFREYAPEAYELDAVDYLLKPVRYTRFIEAIEKAKRNIVTKRNLGTIQSDLIFVKDVMNGQITRIVSSELLAVQGNGNFVLLHVLSSDKPIMTNLSMTTVVDKVRNQKFVQVHKSYIINLQHIVSISGNEITMSKNMKVSLSKHFRTVFLNSIGADKPSD